MDSMFHGIPYLEKFLTDASVMQYSPIGDAKLNLLDLPIMDENVQTGFSGVATQDTDGLLI